MSGSTESWLVPEDIAEQRLDAYVAAHLDEPRNQVQKWIADDRLTVDGKRVKPSLSLNGGERIEVRRPPKVDERVRPEPGDLDVLHADEHLLAVNKPAGIAVHPGAGRPSGTLAHRLLHHFPDIEGVGGAGRPGIVHRLDLGTSGVMLVARTDAAYRALSRAFRKREIDKTYLAICEGQPDPYRGEMAWPIDRHPTRRKRMRTAPEGRPAQTDYRVLATARRSALLELDLHTGRTHQIRVHLKTLGHPLLADEVYGRALPRDWPQNLRQAVEALDRPALHAWRLALVHPVDAVPLQVEAPVPDDLRELWNALSGSDEAWPPVTRAD